MTGKPCICLEKLLPKEQEKTMFELSNKYWGNNVDAYQHPVADRAKEKAQFIAKVGDGLQPLELDILVLRYVYDESFSSIAKELRLIGVETVVRIHDDCLKKLKERLK